MFLIKVLLFFCYCFSSKNILLSLAPFSLGQAIQTNFENKRKHSDSANKEMEAGETRHSKRRKKMKSFHFEQKSTQSKKKSSQSKKKKPYVCNICNKAFSNSFNCNRHRITMHLQEETQAGQESHSTSSQEGLCDQCGKQYSTSLALKIHYKIHTEEKNSRCEFCQKKFSQQSACIRHKKKTCKKKALSGEEIYACHQCGKKFKEKISFKWHQKKHPKEQKEGFKCCSCDQAFVLGGLLAVHTKKHIKEDIKEDIQARLWQFLCREDQSEKGGCIEAYFDRIGLFFHRCTTHRCTENIDEKRLIEYLKEQTFHLLRDLITYHFPSFDEQARNNFPKKSIKEFVERNQTISTTLGTRNIDKSGKPLFLCEPFDTMGKLFDEENLLLKDILNLLLEIRSSWLKVKKYYFLKEYEAILIDLSNKRLSDQELLLFLKILFDLFYENPLPEQIMNILNVNVNVNVKVMNQSA